jgi:hypothetical protein
LGAGSNDSHVDVSADRPQKPIDWFDLSAEMSTTVWRRLGSFVEALVLRYNLQLELRPCWWKHGDAVEELTALWQFRQACFREGAGLNAPMSWQDTFYKSRNRLSGMLSSCRERHVDASFSVWLSDEVRAEFEAFIAFESEERRRHSTGE